MRGNISDLRSHGGDRKSDKAKDQPDNTSDDVSLKEHKRG
jgi:hypothetical protein